MVQAAVAETTAMYAQTRAAQGFTLLRLLAANDNTALLLMLHLETEHHDSLL
jgi:hypothetical protein